MIFDVSSMCRHEKYSIKKFFKEFENRYGVNVPYSF